MWCIFLNLGDMFVIGLTGGIGTGKSHVSRILEELGAAVVDADSLGHLIYRPQTEGWRAVVEHFGEGILAPDGEVDRKKLGPIVFGDPKQLEKLNAITHPLIYKLAEERIRELGSQAQKIVVLEAALLIEARWTSLVDEIWVTTSPEEHVVERLQNRNGMSVEAASARIRSQMPQSERVEYADVVIDNAGDLEKLGKQVENLWYSRVLAHEETDVRDDHN